MALEQECKDILLDCQFNNKAPPGEHLKKLLRQGIKEISKISVNESKWYSIFADHDSSIDSLPCVERWSQEDEWHLLHLKTSQIEIENTAVGRLIREEKRNLLMAALHMNRDEQAEVLLKFQQSNKENDSAQMDSAAV